MLGENFLLALALAASVSGDVHIEPFRVSVVSSARRVHSPNPPLVTSRYNPARDEPFLPAHADGRDHAPPTSAATATADGAQAAEALLQAMSLDEKMMQVHARALRPAFQADDCIHAKCRVWQIACMSQLVSVFEGISKPNEGRFITNPSGAMDPAFASSRIGERGIGHVARVAHDKPARDAVHMANSVQHWHLNYTRMRIPALIHEECLHGL